MVDITCYATKLDSLGMVIDFGKIKELVGAWIDEYLDHNLLVSQSDPLAYWEGAPTGMQREQLIGDRDPWVMEGAPTAENIAKEIFSTASRLLNVEGLSVQNVRVYETPNCWADWSGPPESK